MPITSRLYVFEESGAVKRVPRRIQDALVFGEDAIPEYAGTRQRIATAIVENENGKPVRILDASGSYWTFDSDGKIHRDLHNSLAAAMELGDNAARASRAKVVDPCAPSSKGRNGKRRTDGICPRTIWTASQQTSGPASPPWKKSNL
jgi:hypothetical protein